MEEVITQFTSLEEAEKFDDAHKLITDAINKQGLKSPELCWRHAKVCRDLALLHGKKDKQMYKQYVDEGLLAAENGLKLDENHGKCNCWYAVFLNYDSELQGIKKRIENLYKMKDCWMKAISTDPNDAVSLHALGRWCYEIASLPWAPRKIAQVFFANPPESSYDEALKFLLSSEQKMPNSIANNQLFLAKTYLALHDKTQAKEFLEKLLQLKTKDLEVENAQTEAHSMLKRL